ncbi:MAG: S-adenosylmethionine:tRNA ribosyltransferase-isomerase [Actinomycetia bacterium]|nr:S-adenosylmethionine:tRNA ribosyltransferase-isomerase [Actinomycetes bacterium]
MPLGEEVALDTLQAADQLVHQSAHLGEVAGDGKHLGAEAVLHCVSNARGQGGLELCCRGGERLNLVACALECGVDLRGLDSAADGFCDACLRAGDCFGVHCGRRYRDDRMDVSELDYELPRELIAQHPAARRDESRLLVYERSTGSVRHRRFSELPEELAGELVVVNDTKVVPARIPIESPRGEVLLLERIEGDVWEGLARPTRKLKPGHRYGAVELIEHLGEGRWRLRLDGEPAGATPLPPYITAPLDDPARYQTVYARDPGSAAAPTAGLHFTPELLERLDVERVTLHVGLDTFRPVAEERLEEHPIHGERYEVEPRAWERIRSAERVLAVGTTTVRTLETLAHGGPITGRTELFITPGFEFRRVDALLTNFHLPRSTLLALVMAFAGAEETRALYRLAVEERYRFYSFGDAMLIL